MSRIPDQHLYSILHDAPNENQTSLEFREQMQAAVLLHGNAYAAIDWAADGTCRSLTPIHPGHVAVVKLPTGKPAYDVADGQGRTVSHLAPDGGVRTFAHTHVHAGGHEP